MDWLLIYGLFALTTALTGIYELIYPVFQREEIPWDTLAPKWLFYFVFLVLFLIAAPLVIFSCLVPEWGIRFRETIFEEMMKPTE